MTTLSSPRRRDRHDGIEILEARIAPATLVSLDPATHLLTVHGDYVDDTTSTVQVGAAENLSFTISNGALMITDSTHGVTAIGSGIAQANFNQVSIFLTQLTGDIVVDTGTGADSLSFAGSLALAAGKSVMAKTTGTITFAPTAALSATGMGHLSLTTERDLSIAAGAQLSVVNGGLDLTAHGTLGGNYSGLSLGGTLTSTGTGAITLTGAGGNNADGNNGLDLHGQITASGAGKVVLIGKGGAGNNANTGIYASSGAISAGAGGVLFSGLPGGDAGDSLGIELAIGVTSSGPVDFVTDKGLRFDAGAAVNAGGTTVDFHPATSGTPISLGNFQQSAFAVGDDMLSAITAAKVVIGNALSGAITVANAIHANSSLDLKTGSTLAGAADITLAAGKDLSAETVGSIQLSGVITVPGTLSLTGVSGDIGISLLNSANDFNTVHIAKGASVQLRDSDGFSFDAHASTLLSLESPGLISQLGPITGGGDLLKLGTGTLQLNQANAIGNTTIAVGSIVFNDPGALGSGTITLGLASSGSTDVSLLAAKALPQSAFANPIVVPNLLGGGTVKIGSVASAAGGGVFFDGPLTLNRPTTLLSGSADGTIFEGALSGTLTTLTIDGGTRVALGGALNTFVGDVRIINSSTLELTLAGNAIPDASNVFVEANSTFWLSKGAGGTETINNLTGDGTGSTGPGELNPQNLTVTTSGALFSFDGFITDGGASLSLTKEGAGTATLTNELTYSGATIVKAGTLRLVNPDLDNPISKSALIDVRSGATLDVTGLTPGNDPQTLALLATQTLIGSGTINGNLVGAGKIQPGDASTHGILTINGNFTPTGQVGFKVNSPYTTPGGNYDQIVVSSNGLVDLSGAQILLSGGDAAPAAGAIVKLIANNGPGSTVSGTSPAEGALLGTGFATFTLNYNAGNAHDVVLTASPGQTSLSAALNKGTLTISDTAGRPHRLSYFVSGPNIIINDPVELFASAPVGGQVQGNGHTLSMPVSLVKGVQINGGVSDDSLTVDFGTSSTKLPLGGIIFDGRQQATSVGDQLVLRGINEGAVTYSYTSLSAGTIALSRFGKITLAGLESVVNKGNATSQLFNLPVGVNFAALSDDGVVGNGLTRLSGSTIPATDFTAPTFRGPTGGVSINPGGPTDTLNVLLLPDFDDNLLVGSPSKPFDIVTFVNSADFTQSLEIDTNVLTLPSALHLSAVGGELGIAGGAIDGTLSGALSLVKTVAATPGTPLTLNGANTYTGETVVVDGPLVLGNALAAQNSTVRIFNGEVLQFKSGIGAFTVGGLAGTGALSLVDDAGAPVALNAGANVSTYAGALSGAGTLHKTGAGTLTLTGTNTHSGTFLEDGILQIKSDLALGKAGLALMGDGGTLQAIATTTGARNLVLLSATTFQASAGKTLTLSGVISGSGDFLVGDLGTVLVTGQSNTNTGGIELGGGASEMVNGVSISTPGIHSGVMVTPGATPNDIARIDLTGVNVPVTLILKSPKTGTEVIERIISTDATPVKMISLGAHVTLGNGMADALPDLEVDGALTTLQLSDVNANALIRLGQDLPYLATYKNAPNVTLNNILGAGVMIDVTGDGVHPGAMGGGGLGKVVVNSWPMDGLIKTTQGIKSLTVKSGDAHVSLQVDPNHLGAATTGNVGLISIPAGQWAGANMQVEGVVAQFLTKGIAEGSTITAGAFGIVNIKGTYAGSIFAVYDPTVGTPLPGNKIKVTATGAIGSVAISSGDFTGVVSGDGKVGNLTLTGTARFMGTLRGGSIGNITAASFTGTGALPGDPRHSITAIGSIGNITAKTGGLTDYIIAAGTDLGSDALFGGVADSFHSFYLTTTNVKTAVSIGTVTIKGVVQNTTIAAGIDPGLDGVYGDGNDLVIAAPPGFTGKTKIGALIFDTNPGSALAFATVAPTAVANAFEAQVLTSIKFGNGAATATNPQFKKVFTDPTYFDSGGSSIVVRLLA